MDEKNNSGNRNSGYWNSGYWNSGNRNSGNGNSGHGNSGNRNSGNRNSGDGNSGHWNSGNGNSGDWNSGNRNSGFFCTETPTPTFFDLPVQCTWYEAAAMLPPVELPIGVEWVDAAAMTDAEKESAPSYRTTGGFLRPLAKRVQDAFPLAWAKMTAEEKQKWLDLPNFDAEKFLKCTGVDVRVSQKCEPDSSPAPDRIVLNGVAYVRETTR